MKAVLMLGCGISVAMCLASSCGSRVLEDRYVVNNLRAPAYPLVTIDPYTSAWAFGDTLYEQNVMHWTGAEYPLVGAIKVDGEIYRFMGVDDDDMRVVCPNGNITEWNARYVTKAPAGNWYAPGYDDSTWKVGHGAFGTPDYEMCHTDWNSEHIWVRREVEIPDLDDVTGDIYLEYSHDDNARIYLNGTEIIDTGDSYGSHKYHKLSDEEARLLVSGRNVLAASCYNPRGGGVIDMGLFVKPATSGILSRTAKQRSVTLLPTQTVYEFECGPVMLDFRFVAPMLMDSLEMISRPVNYMVYNVKSTDGQAHEVEMYMEISPNWALNTPGQESLTETVRRNGLHYIRTGSIGQKMLQTSGDRVRIDWGHCYLGADSCSAYCGIGPVDNLRRLFSEGDFSNAICGGNNQRGALVDRLGRGKELSGTMMLGYDDAYSVQFLNENLRPYWNRSGDSDIYVQFANALNDCDALMAKCNAFDRTLMEHASEVGGVKYAELCAAAYRQSIAGHKLVAASDGDLLFFSKENSSNGSIGTVDISYPSMPLYLCYNPDLVKGMMNPIFKYCESGRWNKPFSPHDVGIYPLANGEAYQDEVGMPVEECGNMLIMAAALAKVEGNAEYARQHWNILSRWADYLVSNGFDPSNQLCTDDFAGHMPHNANLSVKAILGIASHGYLAGLLGDGQMSSDRIQLARDLALRWMEAADDGDHYRLAFDRDGTWSQKYNLVWDKLLDLSVFPKEVVEKELAYYKIKQNEFGLPLDSRSDYTKTDWIVWTATLADDKAEFEQFIEPVHKFMHESPDRVPMSDWIYTSRPNYEVFRARPVVGAYFIKMLEDKLKSNNV